MSSRLSPLRTRTHRTSCAVVTLLVTLLLTPSPAFASKLSSDRIGGITLASGAVSSANAPHITARSGHLVASGGPILWARRDGVSRRMASTTKVMTALLVLENCDLDEVVTVSRTAARTRYSTGLKTGERRTVRKLLELTLVHSSNDAATALAEHVGGSVKGFSALMNLRANEFGLADTHYVNPHGLDQKGQYASASDLARLMRIAVKQPEFRRIIKLRTVTLSAYKSRPRRTYKNTDSLLGGVEGLRGGKTGYTNDAGYCFVASARRDGVTLTSVVLDSPSSRARFNSSKALLNWGFKHYRIKQVASADTTVALVPLSHDPSQFVTVKYAETTSTAVLDLLPVVKTRSLPTSVVAPVAQGQLIGVVTISQNGSVLTTVAAVADHAVDAPSVVEQTAAWVARTVRAVTPR